MPTVSHSGPPQRLQELLRSLPGILAGTAPDPHGVGPALRQRLGEALLRKAQEAFRARSKGQAADDGTVWQPTKRPRNDVLYRTGQLYRSLAVQPSPPGQVSVGSSLDYARYHHRGTRTLPAARSGPPGCRLPGWQPSSAALGSALAEIVQRGTI